LKCPGPYIKPVDSTSVAHAIWNYKKNKARSLNASDAINTINSYDLEVTSMITGELSQPNLPTILIGNPTNKNNTMSTLCP